MPRGADFEVAGGANFQNLHPGGLPMHHAHHLGFCAGLGVHPLVLGGADVNHGDGRHHGRPDAGVIHALGQEMAFFSYLNARRVGGFLRQNKRPPDGLLLGALRLKQEIVVPGGRGLAGDGFVPAVGVGQGILACK